MVLQFKIGNREEQIHGSVVGKLEEVKKTGIINLHLKPVPHTAVDDDILHGIARSCILQQRPISLQINKTARHRERRPHLPQQGSQERIIALPVQADLDFFKLAILQSVKQFLRRADRRPADHIAESKKANKHHRCFG